MTEFAGWTGFGATATMKDVGLEIVAGAVAVGESGRTGTDAAITGFATPASTVAAAAMIEVALRIEAARSASKRCPAGTATFARTAIAEFTRCTGIDATAAVSNVGLEIVADTGAIGHSVQALAGAIGAGFATHTEIIATPAMKRVCKGIDALIAASEQSAAITSKATSAA